MLEAFFVGLLVVGAFLTVVSLVFLIVFTFIDDFTEWSDTRATVVALAVALLFPVVCTFVGFSVISG